MSITSVSSHCIPTQDSPQLFNKTFESIGPILTTTRYLTPTDQSALRCVSSMSKEVVDVHRSLVCSMYFRKKITEIEKLEERREDQDKARKTLTRDFFSSRDIAKLPPIALTALFESLYSRFLITDETTNAVILQEIAVQFFSSDSTSEKIGKLSPRLYAICKKQWDGINQDPDRFFKKLCPLNIDVIVECVLKASKIAVPLTTHNDRLYSLVPFMKWVVMNEDVPDTLRSPRSYETAFTDEKGLHFMSYVTGMRVLKLQADQVKDNKSIR
jgi:hypothetical protein